MKNVVWSLISVVIIVAVSSATTRHFFPRVETVVEADTVFVDREYEVTVVETIERPVIVTRYITEVDTVRTVEVRYDTVYVETDTDNFQYHSSFLTQYPNAHKFLGLIKQNDRVSLTTQSPNGTTDTNTWHVGDNDYQIGGNVALQQWTPRKTTINHKIEAGYLFFSEYSPYISYRVDYQWRNVGGTVAVYATQQPFVTIGLYYEL